MGNKKSKAKLLKAIAALQDVAREGGPLIADTPSTEDGERTWFYASAGLVEERVGSLLSRPSISLMLLPPDILSEADRVRVRWTIVHEISGQSLKKELTLPLTLDGGIREINAAIATANQSRRWLLLWLAGLQPLQPGAAEDAPEHPAEKPPVSKTRAPEELADHIERQLAQRNVVRLPTQSTQEYEHLVPDVEDIGEDDDTEAVDWVTAAADAWSLGEDDVELDESACVRGSMPMSHHNPQGWASLGDKTIDDAIEFYRALSAALPAAAKRLDELEHEKWVRSGAGRDSVDASNAPAFIPATPTWSELTDIWGEYVKTTEPDNGPWLSTPLKRTLAGFIKAVLDLPKKPASPTRDQVERVRRALNRYIGKAKQCP